VSTASGWDSGLKADLFACASTAYAPQGAGIRQLIAGCLVRVEDRLLLSRRATAPRIACWTIPGGFVEPGESAHAGALRELAEETGVSIGAARLLAVYEMPQISQILFLFTALARACAPRPGPESLEVGLFAPRRVPWSELAFASDRRTVLRLRARSMPERVEVGRFQWGDDGRIVMRAPGAQARRWAHT
jgi:ADP-ribose pyrophosphatase YjhB (NUDIX family)